MVKGRGRRSLVESSRFELSPSVVTRREDLSRLTIGLSMSSSDFIVFGAPNIEQDEIDEVVDCLKSGWIGTGPRVARFEKEFAEYKNRPFAAALSSCTAAMHLSVLAAGI